MAKPKQSSKQSWKNCFKIYKKKVTLAVILSLVSLVLIGVMIGEGLAGQQPKGIELWLSNGLSYLLTPIFYLVFNFFPYNSFIVFALELFITGLVYYYLLISLIELIIFITKKGKNKQ